MAHVRLANWHGDAAPGDVIEVPDDQVQGLRYDGRISEVVDESDVQSPAETEPVNVSTESESAPTAEQSEKLAEPRRRRGKSDE